MAMHLSRFLVDRLIRRKARLHRTPLDRYEVRVARSVAEYEDAFRLLHAGYVYQGIESVQAPDLRFTRHHLLPQAHVLVVYESGVLVGTMTVTLDSSAGLPLDKDYGHEINALRHNGARLVEYGSYAIVERCWSSGVSNLLYFAANAVASKVLDATDVVIGVHPRAARFYRAVFNFESLGAAREHTELRAPVVALKQNLAMLKPFLSRHYRTPMQSGQLPVEHFFVRPLPCVRLCEGFSGLALKRGDRARAAITQAQQRVRATSHLGGVS